MNKRVRLGLIGNPSNRRLRDFSAAWQRLGQAAPLVIDYADLPSTAPAVDVLRLDSPGEHPELSQHLIAIGGSPNSELEHGEVAYLREFHNGYCQLLERIQAWRLPTLNAPSEIAKMFDKWQCHQQFVAANIARPTSSLAPNSFAEWCQQRPVQGRVFLKPLHGSSSSGVCALRWQKDLVQLISPIEIDNGKLYNNLKVRHYQSWSEVEFILSRLLPQGMICERWIPKLSLPGGVIDLRVLVIDGRARHCVVRQSDSPMTNLHLGNRRACAIGLEPEIAQAKCLAEQAAATFPNSLYAGVDVLLDHRGRSYIGEINAFGDLLPGLLDEGEDAYTAIASAFLRRLG